MSLPTDFKNNIHFDAQANRYLYRHHNVWAVIAHYIAKSDLPSPPHAKAPYASFHANQVMMPVVLQNDGCYRRTNSGKVLPCIPLAESPEDVRKSYEHSYEKYPELIEKKIKRGIEEAEKRLYFKST